MEGGGMGKIVYCNGCGNMLREKEFARGLAHSFDHRHFCARCLPLYANAPTPTLPVAPEPGFVPPKALHRSS
jgi:hypothetical protein